MTEYDHLLLHIPPVPLYNSSDNMCLEKKYAERDDNYFKKKMKHDSKVYYFNFYQTKSII